MQIYVEERNGIMWKWIARNDNAKVNVGMLVVCLVLWLDLHYVIEEPHPSMVILVAFTTGLCVLNWALWTFWPPPADPIE